MNQSIPNGNRSSPYFRRTSSIQLSQNTPECRRIYILHIQQIAICLQPVKVRGKIPCCNHIFCYVCICEWSKVTNSCPLCKANFHDIEKCEVVISLADYELQIDGSICKGERRRNVIHVDDKQQDNDVIYQEFMYVFSFQFDIDIQIVHF